MALRERQHPAMADTTFHATPPRTVPHAPNDHAPHWCSVHAETDARTRRLQEVRQRVQLRSTSGARGVVTRLRWFYDVWPHRLCRPFHTRYFPVGIGGDLSVSNLCKLGSLNASFLYASWRDSASVKFTTTMFTSFRRSLMRKWRNCTFLH